LAEVEAATFHDVDSLVVLAYEDQGFSPFLLQELGGHAARCASGGVSYSPTFDDRGDAVDGVDHTPGLFPAATDPAVVSYVVAHHEPDPCGENPLPYIASNPQRLSSVTIPVLLVYGGSDVLFDPTLAPVQASHFGSRDVTVDVIPGAGHVLTVDRRAPAFRADVGRWLDRRGF
jgi:pimeloyl-ACP methyl ester carboxylesterase